MQQAIAQKLMPLFEPQFVETSYGFRPGRSCKDAIYTANAYLDEGRVWVADHELEKREHKFVRCADDMVIFCKSKASAEQALAHIIPFIEEKLFLRVNRAKTFTGYATEIKFPGFGFYKSKTGWYPTVHAKSKAKCGSG